MAHYEKLYVTRSASVFIYFLVWDKKLVKIFPKSGPNGKKMYVYIVEGILQIRQRMSKTKSVVDGLRKACYNNFGSKTQVDASKSAKHLE